ncbi:hypothetical protein [Pedobacter aquatilis]|uniref:hypothetical protein n=1 Tax=Pedobacter aquatilis TaxID=351343 RepID=UPI00292E40CB|nr:hypothetical protein [Pedobacter aquatilis]
MLKKILAFVIIIVCSIKLHAQVNKADSVANLLEHYGLRHKSSILFVHFDKNVYTNNDQVWLTGYLLKTVTDLNHYTTLYLSLINDADSSVVQQNKFLIDKGFAFGSLVLPDSIQSGNYRFVAHTNVKLNGKPDVEFVQPIVIKSTTVNPLKASLSIFKTNDEKTGNGTVLLKALTSDNRFIPDAEVIYTVGRDNNFILKGKAKTSIIGEVMIDYPTGKITDKNNLISVTIRKDKYTRFQKIELPVQTSHRYQVNFYPEGGYLVSEIENKIGWEVKDSEGSMMSVKAILFAGDKILDTIASNSYGMGQFYISPKENLKYSIKLIKDDGLFGEYQFPSSLKNGTNIKFASAIGNNELRLSIESNMNTVAHLVIHNYENLYSITELKLSPKKQVNVLLKLDSVPRGLNTATLLDSMYLPIAERIFFAHYDEIENLNLLTDKNQYSTRDSVKLDIEMLPKGEILNNGLVSIAVVQENRISLSNKKNIVDYNYLENNLVQLPANSTGLKFNDTGYLEDILLIKGWRRYKWPQRKDDFVKHDISSIEYFGAITKGKKPLKIPLELSAISGANVNLINTDSTGQFVLPYQALIAEPTKKIWFSLGNKNFADYTVKINDPFDEIKSVLSQLNYSNSINKFSVLSATENISALAGIKLKEVTINKSKDNSTNFQSAIGRNECGDYVCSYGFLNCNNHSFGTLPIKGKNYPSNGRIVTYAGCMETKVNPNFLVLNSIEMAKEFYVSDIKNINEPINFATIYWNYQIFINSKDKTSLTFTTGDLTGDFRIIIQGVTQNGPIYGEKLISITK